MWLIVLKQGNKKAFLNSQGLISLPMWFLITSKTILELFHDIDNLIICFIIHLFIIFNPHITDSRFKLIPNKDILLKLLAGISYLWFDIGEALKVPFSELMNLRCINDPGLTKLSIVLQYWIDQHTTDVTWNTIIAVIKSETINQIKVGEMIRRHVLNIKKGDASNVLNEHGDEQVGGRHYRRKEILDKSMAKRGYKKHKGKFNAA